MNADRRLQALRYYLAQRGRGRSSLGATSTSSHGLNRTYGFSLALLRLPVSQRDIFSRDGTQKRAHMKARLRRRVMELWADRAGAARQAAVVPAVGSSRAQHVVHASIEIEAVLERVHRTA